MIYDRTIQRDKIRELYHGIILWGYIMEGLYIGEFYGTVLQDRIQLYYGIMLRNYTTGLCYGIILQDQLTESYYGMILWNYITESSL